MSWPTGKAERAKDVGPAAVAAAAAAAAAKKVEVTMEMSTVDDGLNKYREDTDVMSKFYISKTIKVRITILAGINRLDVHHPHGHYNVVT